MKHYYFFGRLDMERATSIVNFILKCKSENESAVMLIDSPGGDVPALEPIYAVLKDTGVHLTTIGVGMVASAASIIFAMGDERILLPGTEYLIHYARKYANSDTPMQRFDFEKGLAEANAIFEKDVEMLSKTKITKDVIEEKCVHGIDWILTPEELKEYGVITKDAYKGWTDLFID